MTRTIVVAAAMLAMACGGTGPATSTWGCCDAYKPVASDLVDEGRNVRFLDCDGIREFTCFIPDDLTSENTAAVRCWNDAGETVPYWATDRACR